MLIKPPAKPIDFRSLLIIYYSNDTSIGRITRVGTSIFSAPKSSLRCGRYDVTNSSTTFWQHKVHFNYLKSLNMYISNLFKTIIRMHCIWFPFKSFLKSVLWSHRKQSNLYFHSAYSLSVIYNPLPVVHFFPANYLKQPHYAAPLVIDWWSLIYHS